MSRNYVKLYIDKKQDRTNKFSFVFDAELEIISNMQEEEKKQYFMNIFDYKISQSDCFSKHVVMQRKYMELTTQLKKQLAIKKIVIMNYILKKALDRNFKKV